jgi:hypothetical protein
MSENKKSYTFMQTFPFQTEKEVNCYKNQPLTYQLKKN